MPENLLAGHFLRKADKCFGVCIDHYPMDSGKRCVHFIFYNPCKCEILLPVYTVSQPVAPPPLSIRPNLLSL
jgi:hypothetical protein